MVTRASIVWVMTGIAAGAAGGWLWNRERSVEVAAAPAAASREEAVRSPFAPPREERTRQPASRQPENPAGARRAAEESKAASPQLRAIESKAAQADRDELESMLADASSLPPGQQRRRTLEILLLRYAEIDADGALTYAMAADRATAKHLMGTLADVVPERAWERAVREGDPAARLAYLQAVVASWATQEPQRVFAAVRELPADWQRNELLRHAAAAIAIHDPPLAVELVEAMDPTIAAPLLDTVATVWSRDDPSAAARWVESKPVAVQGRLAYRIAEAYLAHKPTEALAWALRISRSPQRYLWSSMLGQMATYDPEQALQLALSAESPTQRTQAMGNVLASIAQRDPALAMSHLTKIPSSELRANVVSRIAESVAARTPSAAIEWLNGIDDRRMQRQAATSLGYELARRDVEAAAQLLERLPEYARRSWINAVAQAYADTDVEKGKQWVRRHAKESPDVAFGFAQMVAARSPQLALQLVEEAGNDRERERLLPGVLPMVAQQMPEAAAEWVEKLPDGSARLQAIDAVAATWAHHDPEAARKWVLSLPSGQERDQAISTFIQAQELPVEEVLSVINRIQMPERRMHAVLTAAMRLSRSDPEGAQTLLRRHPLDPERQRQYDEYARQQGAGQ